MCFCAREDDRDTTEERERPVGPLKTDFCCAAGSIGFYRYKNHDVGFMSQWITGDGLQRRGPAGCSEIRLLEGF